MTAPSASTSSVSTPRNLHPRTHAGVRWSAYCRSTRSTRRALSPDDLPRLFVLQARHGLVHRDPFGGHEPLFTLGHGVLAPEKLQQEIVDRLVVEGVLGAPEERVALLAQVGHHADVRDAGLLTHLA